jgi:glyoxylase-like metal-dependent hydrolase (beta-lactamase superfamily II)
MLADHSLAVPVTGETVRLSARVRRVVARNAGPLTGAGTNTYVVGTGELAVIDPGPDDVRHLDAILACCDAPLAWILVTHTHPDHSPGARVLRERTGATVLGRRAPDAPRQDRRFRPDVEPTDGERVLLEGAVLRCIETPGHASNHVCFLLEEERLLFTGDHVLGGVTPVILAPDGDMTDYLAALGRLRAVDLEWLAPGHGPLLPEPAAVIDGLVAHRLRREAKVIDRLGAIGAGSLDDLLPGVYDDVAPALHELARHTLLAHLLKLERDGVAVRDGAAWRSRSRS